MKCVSRKNRKSMSVGVRKRNIYFKTHIFFGHPAGIKQVGFTTRHLRTCVHRWRKFLLTPMDTQRHVLGSCYLGKNSYGHLRTSTGIYGHLWAPADIFGHIWAPGTFANTYDMSVGNTTYWMLMDT